MIESRRFLVITVVSTEGAGLPLSGVRSLRHMEPTPASGVVGSDQGGFLCFGDACIFYLLSLTRNDMQMTKRRRVPQRQKGEASAMSVSSSSLAQRDFFPLSEDEEPKLRYRRLGGSVPDILGPGKDVASCMAGSWDAVFSPLLFLF